jgi:two-component system CheB/CheR fusion protein
VVKDVGKPSHSGDPGPGDWVQIDADRAIRDQLKPIGVVIDKNLNILRFLGDTSEILTHRSGEEASINLARMTPLGLMASLRSAIHEADVKEITVKNSVQQLTTDASKSLSLNFEVIPYRGSVTKERQYVILLDAESAATPPQLGAPGTDVRASQDHDRIVVLENSLSEARVYLNNLLESEQSANEQLRAANEEIVASNEELQSTNEELQSAKEEIVASNEELQIVNDEIRQKNIALVDLNRDYLNTLKSSSVAILLVSDDLKCRSMTAAAQKILGINDFYAGMELKQVIKRCVFPELDDIVKHLDGHQDAVSIPLADIDGHWYQWRVGSYFIDESHVAGAVIAISDIDLLKKTIAELEDTRRFNEAVLDTAPVPLVVLDGEFKILMANQIFGKIFDADPQAVHGKSILEVSDGVLDIEGFREFLEVTMKQGRLIKSFVVDSHGGSAGHRYLKITSERLSPQDTGGQMILVAFDDLTREKLAEERIQNALTVAERANRSKSEFLANISHEIRSPLTAILGFTELLSRDITLSSGQLEHVMKVDANARHLTSLIDEILDLSKIESGKFEINLARTDLTKELAETLGLLKNRAEQKGLKFEVVLATPIPAFISTSDLRLRQILLNIIGNAVKFTECGEIRVSIGMTPNGLFSMTVHDTGPGLTPEQRERIFLPFGQADSSVTRKYGGSGLGLILSRHLAESLGGNVELTDSRPGEGSTFRITIGCGDIHDAPMVGTLGEFDWWRPHPETVAAKPPNDLSGIRVLLVEDSPDIREVLTLFIKSGGASVVTAQNGVEAVELAKSGDFSIVLMDIQMPLMDGYEATRKLRTSGYKIPILALTAHALTGEREKCLAAGCDDYIIKPVMAHKLIEMISRFAIREPKV